MHVRRYPLCNEAEAAVSTGSPAAAPAATPAAPAPAEPVPAAGAPAASAAPAVSAPAAPAAQPGSLLARGAADAAAAPAPAGGDGEAGDKPAAIPDKYIVKREDGSTDWEASALKQAQGYGELAKRLGQGEAPPQTPEGYAPELPQGVSMEQLKTDPLFAGFLKGAHAVGLNNKQVSYLLGEFQQRVQLMNDQAADPAVAEAELGKVWQTPQQMQRGLQGAYRGTHAFAADQEHAQRLEKKFGSDPDFIRLMAKVGSELGEDRLPEGGLTQVETESLESLRRSEAYNNSKHPDHAKTVAKVNALYAKKHPN